MKIAFSMMLMTLTSLAFGSDIKITSFTRVVNGQNLAELCGKVNEVKATPTFIKIISDPGSSRPATYNTIADENGKFCVVLQTYRGSAEASVMGESLKTKTDL